MTIIQAIKNASPIVFRSTLNKEIDRRLSDAAYFKAVKEKDEEEFKKLSIKYQALFGTAQKQTERIKILKRDLNEVITAKSGGHISLESDVVSGSSQKVNEIARTNNKEIAPDALEKSIHLAQIQAGDNWQAQNRKYYQVKEHFVNFKRQVASVVDKIMTSPVPETMEQALGFFESMRYASDELQAAGAYDPALTFDDILAIYGDVKNVPDYLLSDEMKEKKAEIIEIQEKARLEHES